MEKTSERKTAAMENCMKGKNATMEKTSERKTAAMEKTRTQSQKRLFFA